MNPHSVIATINGEIDMYILKKDDTIKFVNTYFDFSIVGITQIGIKQMIEHLQEALNE